MASEKLDSSKTIEIVKRHKESVKGYVRRHDPDIYQINKLIKAETALRDRNSVLNFLRKEKKNLRRYEAIKKDYGQDPDIKEPVEKPQNIIEDLKEDVKELEGEISEISPKEIKEKYSKSSFKNSEEKSKTSSKDVSNLERKITRLVSSEDTENEAKSYQELEKDVNSITRLESIDKSYIGSSSKSRRKLHEEVENHFDSLPQKDEKVDGILSNFNKLLPGRNQKDVASLAEGLKPEHIFNEIEGKNNREKAIKAAYTVKRTLENNHNENLDYEQIANEIQDMNLDNSEKTADFFRYMEDYDYLSTPEIDELDKILNDCRAVVKSFS